MQIFVRCSLDYRALAVLLALFNPVACHHLRAETIPVKYRQGPEHGFLLLRSEEHKVIAVGDLLQTVRGAKVYSRLTFHFNDGSIDDDVTIFEQHDCIKLISDHHVQKGPSFPQSLDLAIDVPAQQATWREPKDPDHKSKSEHMDLPDDLVNGMVPVVLENMPENAAEAKFSYVAGGSKPRLIKLAVRPEGKETFLIGGRHRPNAAATRYDIHIEIGGLAGMIAPIVGKQPPDIYVWVIGGAVPSFARMKGPLFTGGPIWTIELTSPVLR